jgi:vitamin B12 transporter
MALLCLAFPLAESAAAQDDGTPTTIISASRVPMPSPEVGSAVFVLPQERIEASGEPFVSELLRQAPGVAVSRQGTMGASTQVRIRGGETRQTLVLIDGIEANDPSFNSEFDFAHVLTGGIGSFEVLRGPQSALYGSDATGGVIQLNSQRATKPFELSAFAEGGSFDTYQAGGLMGTKTDRYDVAVSAQWLDTNGTNISRFGDERDGYRNTTFGAAGGVQLTPILSIDGSVRYIDAQSEYDTQDFAFPATPTQGLVIDSDDRTDVTRLYATAQARLDLMDGRWQHRVRVARTQTDSDVFQAGAFSSSNDGERSKYDYQTTYSFDTPALLRAQHGVTLAYEHEEQSFQNRGATPAAGQDQDASNSQNSFVGEYRVGFFDQLFLTAGARHDNNQTFDDTDTYRITAAFLIPASATRLHGSYGTGVNDPSLFELYGSIPPFFVGNPNVKPQKTKGYDFGVEQSLLNKQLVLDVTYFDADLEQEIVSVFNPSTFVFSVDNLDGRSTREGVEVTATWRLTDSFSLAAAYTYTDARQPDGDVEVRRPRNIASLNALWRFLGGRGLLNVAVDYTGDQEDNEFVSATPQERVTLPAFTLVNVRASYALTRNVTLTARIENLFDVQYEEVYSYRAPGFGAFAGVRVGFP